MIDLSSETLILKDQTRKMNKKDENTPASETLGATLYKLGLLTADEYQFQRMLNSPEFKNFEEQLKMKGSPQL